MLPEPIPAGTTACRFRCGGTVPQARLDHGYTHCSAPNCVVRWRKGRLIEHDLALVLVPKSGFTIVHKSDVIHNTKSSGK